MEMMREYYEDTDEHKRYAGMLSRSFREKLLFEPPVEKKISYSKDSLFIAKKLDGSPFRIDLQDAIRIMFLGISGGGKTFFIRSIIDRLRKLGIMAFFLNDPKNEWYTSNKPVQAKFQFNIMEGEKPQGHSVTTLRPTFFQTHSEKLDEQNVWYSIDMARLTKEDFMDLFNVEKMTRNQSTAFEQIYLELKERLSLEGTEYSHDLLEEIIYSVSQKQGLTEKQAEKIINVVSPLRESRFHVPEHQKSIEELLNKGICPSINMKNFNLFRSGTFHYPEVLLNMALREVLVARRARRIPPLFIVMDEASQLIAKNKRYAIKESVQDSYKLDRAENVSWISVFQDIEDPEEDIYKMSRYIFVPSSADTQTIRKLLINLALTQNVQRSNGDAMRLKDKLKKHKYSWLVFDRHETSMTIVKPLSPLSHHLETE